MSEPFEQIGYTGFMKAYCEYGGMLMNHGIELFGHRGASGHYPENTLSAFEAAKRSGADGIKFSVRMSKDHQLMVIHDESVNRTTNGSGIVRNMNYEELKKLDAGSWFNGEFSNETIMTLHQVAEWATQDGNRMRLNIELKNDSIDFVSLERAVLRLTRYYELENRVIISSFNPKSLMLVRALHPTIEIGYLVEGVPQNAVAKAKKIGASSIHCQEQFALSSEGQKTLAAGLSLRVYPVNDKSRIEPFYQAGVSAVMTDFPDDFVKEYSLLVQSKRAVQ
ncbi:glycerophosphoryl diester phosphodiesterase [Jeotgalibacillus soli]|uniref:Glycerophosphoryl diester phosphodiesterase n=1 Tax=Jeotgalibacillus soli TaxID=889306 RepID=A0A0C2W7F1_9BACL|nr:glycerophosphoryl diester phosphodiesterase [Jeotgalibacillus soli]